MGLGLAGRRLRRLLDLSMIVITIKQRTPDEAATVAADLDAARRLGLGPPDTGQVGSWSKYESIWTQMQGCVLAQATTLSNEVSAAIQQNPTLASRLLTPAPSL